MRYGLRVAAPSPHQEAMAAACSITCTAVTPTNNWITDRRPTEADGDRDGDVLAQYHPDGDGDLFLHWSHVGEATPWKHCADWQPPTAAPEPAPTKPALAVGQRWRRRDGEVVTVWKHSDGVFFAAGWCYQSNGMAPTASPHTDLVELLFTPPTTPTPRKFKETPNRTVTDFGHIIDAIDEDGVAWWMGTASDDGPEHEWQKLLPLPGREVVANG